MSPRSWAFALPFRRDPVRDGFWLAVVIWCCAILIAPPAVNDAVGWWNDPLPNTYVGEHYASGVGFYFSPPIAFAFYPLTLLPWPVFSAVWTGIMLTALGVLAGRYAALWIFVPFVWWEISASNVALLIALAVVVGMRWPAAWSFVLLTKMTPGVGLLWFVVRREWTPLLVALATTLGIAALTFVLAPTLWFQWGTLMAATVGESGPGYFTVPIPLVARLVVACLVVTWGALTDRPWTVVLAAVLGTPVLWLNALAGLVGVVPLLADPKVSGQSMLWRWIHAAPKSWGYEARAVTE